MPEGSAKLKSPPSAERSTAVLGPRIRGAGLPFVVAGRCCCWCPCPAWPVTLFAGAKDRSSPWVPSLPDCSAALFAFENAVAAAYRSSSAGVRPGGAGSGGGGVLARFGGAGKGGQGASIEQSLAALQMLKELEVRMYVLAASMGLVTLRMEPELISAEDSM